MQLEKIQKLALIAEIIGGIAVIGTLLILVVEIRSNTDAIRISTYDTLAADVSNWRANLAANESLSEASIVFFNGDSATELQQSRVNNYYLSLFFILERAYLQWESGYMDDDMWERFKRTLCAPYPDTFEQNIGVSLDQLTTGSFTEYRRSGSCRNL